MVPIQHAFDRIAEIIELMKAVCDLYRLWGSARCSLRIGGAPVAGQGLCCTTSVTPNLTTPRKS